MPGRDDPPLAGGVWADDPSRESWHWDSSLPASERSSDLPAEVPSEGPSLASEPEASESSGVPLGPIEEAQRRRSKTIARKQMLRERRRMIAQGALPEVLDYERPMTRAQCRDGRRPCLYVSCRYHLYLDVNPVTGSIKLNFPDIEVKDLEESCALDVAERGGITLEEVGDIMNLTRERIRQVEVSGLDKLRTGEADLITFLDGHESTVGGQSPAGQRRLKVLDE